MVKLNERNLTPEQEEYESFTKGFEKVRLQFAWNFKELLDFYNIGQKDVAERLGLSGPQGLTRYVRTKGAPPLPLRAERAQEIADYFDIPLTYLYKMTLVSASLHELEEKKNKGFQDIDVALDMNLHVPEEKRTIEPQTLLMKPSPAMEGLILGTVTQTEEPGHTPSDQRPPQDGQAPSPSDRKTRVDGGAPRVLKAVGYELERDMMDPGPPFALDRSQLGRYGNPDNMYWLQSRGVVSGSKLFGFGPGYLLIVREESDFTSDRDIYLVGYEDRVRLARLATERDLHFADKDALMNNLEWDGESPLLAVPRDMRERFKSRGKPGGAYYFLRLEDMDLIQNVYGRAVWFCREP